MKYPLLAAALLAFAVSACSDQTEAPAAPMNDEVAVPAEQTPAPVEEAPMAAPAPADEAPAAEAPTAPAEEAPAPAAEAPAAVEATK